MLDRPAAIAWYHRNRERSRALFDLLAPQVYYSRPIALRHPIVFYEGHLPAFSFNTLIKKALGGASIDERLELLFARGIDPHESASEPNRLTPDVTRGAWPSRDEVRAFAAEADRRVLDALSNDDLDRPGHPLLDRAEAVFTILEHEAMHHETLLYMWHRLPLDEKRRPAGYSPRVDGRAPDQEWVEVPPGCATLGVNREDVVFGWDNEFPSQAAEVGGFAIDRYDVTNLQFLEFVDGGGYSNPRWWTEENWSWIQSEHVAHPLFWERSADWNWRGMFDRVPLPLSWPVFVSHAEASAYARWRSDRDGLPVRLPTEAEYQRAAFGSPDGERPHPWGDAPPAPDRGVFDFSGWDPEPVGGHPKGRSAWGADDLVGNGWEWTSSVFAPFPRFRPMASYPEYSADFFDGEHLVMKGASPVTAAELLRPTFRNWFRPRYPYVYATFRCVTERSRRR
ncbi:MAG TPA: SUMF1/EgtB/PvdO family nonheme iron enzyme [Vicinamibacterales bacterium]|nr:SUMF1/EgtB/PvdO family nonheme iron enzyme [Vicinamibacterales bacterium]